MRRYDINPLYRYFTKVMGKENVDKLFSLYRVGTSKMWGGATVFWQIDRNGNADPVNGVWGRGWNLHKKAVWSCLNFVEIEAELC